MIKMKIRLLEHNIDVVLADQADPCMMGRANLKDQKISLNLSMGNDTLSAIFLHELLHIIASMLSLPDTEITTDGYAVGMLSFIRNNPKTVKLIQSGNWIGDNV